MAKMTTVQEHNNDVLSSLEPGDQVEFDRMLYFHWAVYIGDGYVIHLASPDGQTFSKIAKAVVRRDKIKKVAANNKMYKNNSKGEKYGLKAFSKYEIVERAKSQLDRTGYNLLASKCEHFVSWCCYDIEISDQVDDRIELTAKAAKTFFSWLLEKVTEKACSRSARYASAKPEDTDFSTLFPHNKEPVEDKRNLLGLISAVSFHEDDNLKLEVEVERRSGYGRHQDNMPVSSNSSDTWLNAAVLDSDSDTDSEIDDHVDEE